MPPVQCRCPVNFGLSWGENCAGRAKAGRGAELVHVNMAHTAPVLGPVCPGHRIRIQGRRSRGLSSVKGTACSTRAKYSASSFSACARVATGAPQFTDPIATSTTMKARVIVVVYWVKVIGVAPLDEFRD